MMDSTFRSVRYDADDLSRLLDEINEEGGFLGAVLTDCQGLVVASAAAASRDADTHSAVVARVQQTVSQVCGQLGMAQMDEISLVDAAGHRLVYRLLNAGSQQLLLAVLVADKNTSYRRLVNRVMRAIQDMLAVDAV